MAEAILLAVYPDDRVGSVSLLPSRYQIRVWGLEATKV